MACVLMVRIFVDKKLSLPIRYAAWTWPREPGAKPILLEEYTYTNLRLNRGFTDLEFDPCNPNYHFP